jgi:16S rRNA (guanine(966)-N(2))-methyltransferase RsmD
MRITGGTLKGQMLKGGFAAHVRPTTDFVREALMNYLSHRHEIPGADVLDLFSGSGIMALEFLSRGAGSVISVDKDTKNIRYQQEIQKEKNLTAWQVVRADVFKFLEGNEPAFDIIFADPPYDLPSLVRLPELALLRLKPNGVFILEHSPGMVFTTPPSEIRKYGSSAIGIFIP